VSVSKEAFNLNSSVSAEFDDLEDRATRGMRALAEDRGWGRAEERLEVSPMPSPSPSRAGHLKSNYTTSLLSLRLQASEASMTFKSRAILLAMD
jgi:hypothetical protein